MAADIRARRSSGGTLQAVSAACSRPAPGRRRPAAGLVGFDRSGWSPALFAHMDAQGFDVLT